MAGRGHHPTFVSRTWLDTASGVRVPPQDRHIGYMAQDYALFPCYTVAGNIAYGLGHLSASDRHKRVDEMVELFQLRGMEAAKPRELSGGQQQRVALARGRPLVRCCCCWMNRVRLGCADAGAPQRRIARAVEATRAAVDHRHARLDGSPHAWRRHGRHQRRERAPSRRADRRVQPSAKCGCRACRGVETVVKGRVVGSAGGMVQVSVNGTTLTAVEGESAGPDVFACIRAEDVVLEQGRASGSSARNHLTGNGAGSHHAGRAGTGHAGLWISPRGHGDTVDRRGVSACYQGRRHGGDQGRSRSFGVEAGGLVREHYWRCHSPFGVIPILTD